MNHFLPGSTKKNGFTVLFFFLGACFCCGLGTSSRLFAIPQEQGVQVQELDAAPPPKSHWEMSPCPLRTVYSDDFSPERVHPEYPRPCMVREQWLSLNGIWELRPKVDPQHPGARDIAPTPRRSYSEIQFLINPKDLPGFNSMDFLSEPRRLYLDESEESPKNPPPPEKEPAPEPLGGIEFPKPEKDRKIELAGFSREIRSKQESSSEEFSYRVLVPFPLESPLSGIRYPFERFSYRREFSIPEHWSSGDRILLHFEAVDWETAVILNGKLVGTHQGGYDPFSFDITEHLLENGFYDPKKSHELIVSVYDPTEGIVLGKQARIPSGGKYTSFSGIWQSVWLEPVPPSWIVDYRATPNVDQRAVSVEVRIENAQEDQILIAEVLKEGRSLGKVYGGPQGSVLISIPEQDLVLWSPENPFLYRLKLSLVHANRVLDQVEGYFGMRKIDLAKDAEGMVRIRINDEFLFQNGVLDPGYWPEGISTAPNEEAIVREISTIKELGFNMIRKHAKVEPQRWYYWCDRLGIFIWQDMPASANRFESQQKQFEAELQRLVESRYNHPSIITWVLFHEGAGQHKTEYYTELVRTMDPKRLVNSASGWRDWGVGHILDLHKYPGPIAPKAGAFRAGAIGDFGGIALVIAPHCCSANPWGYHLAKNEEEYRKKFLHLMEQLDELREPESLSAAVYHQWTDVESECTGLLTYDRKVVKIPVRTLQQLNRRLQKSR